MYFYSLCTFSLINRKCVLLYLCVYGCISDIFPLYYWIYAISLCISLLYLRSHFVPKIIRITGAVAETLILLLRHLKWRDWLNLRIDQCALAQCISWYSQKAKTWSLDFWSNLGWFYHPSPIYFKIQMETNLEKKFYHFFKTFWTKHGINMQVEKNEQEQHALIPLIRIIFGTKWERRYNKEMHRDIAYI